MWVFHTCMNLPASRNFMQYEAVVAMDVLTQGDPILIIALFITVDLSAILLPPKMRKRVQIKQ